MVAAFFRYAMSYGSAAEDGLWDWDISLCLGSIVTATDPVAVVAALHSLGAPEKLADVIDGEALLNDGSAMVMFLIFFGNARSKALGLPVHTIGSGVALFFQLSAGGFALGALAFLIVSTWLLFVENDWRVETGILLVGIYATFSIAENYFHVSGVLAVVTLGLLMSRRGKYAFSPSATAVVEAAAPLIAHVSETLIFFVAGIAAWNALYAHREQVQYTDALILYVVLHVVRLVGFMLQAPLLARMGYKLNWREGALIVYAGLRGAVSLALALLLIEEEAISALDRARIHFLVASTAILTMLINGTTTQAFYQRLNIYPANAYRDVIVQRVIADLEGRTMDETFGRLCAHDALYSRADLDVVRALVPSLAGVRVLPNNRLVLPESVRTRVFDAGLLRKIAASEPAEAVALRSAAETPTAGMAARDAGSTGRSMLRARGGPAAQPEVPADDGALAPPRTKRMRSKSHAALVAAVSSSAIGELPAAAGAADAAPQHAARLAVKKRRASTGAMADVKEMMHLGDEARLQQDPRKEWRAQAAQFHAEQELQARIRRRESSGAVQNAAPAGGGAKTRQRSFVFESLGAALRVGTIFGGAPSPRPPPPTTDPSAAGDAGGGAKPPADPAMLGRLEQLAHRDRRFAPTSSVLGTDAGADAGAGAGGAREASVSISGLDSLGGGDLRGSFRRSFELPHAAQYTRADKRDGIVETLFAVIRKLYSEQYEHKQLAGVPLAALIEALSSGEEYLAEFPHATAAAAFDLELDMVLWQLPAEPPWRRLLHRVPVLGAIVRSHLDFYAAFDRTEALAGYIRAHEELAHVVAHDATRMRVVREAVMPAVARARAELVGHHLERWSLVSFQINMLAARAAVLLKREEVDKIAETGALTDADVDQLGPVFDRSLYLLDTVRFSVFAPYRYARLLRTVHLNLETGAPALGLVKVAPSAPAIAIVRESSQMLDEPAAIARRADASPIAAIAHASAHPPAGADGTAGVRAARSSH